MKRAFLTLFVLAQLTGLALAFAPRADQMGRVRELAGDVESIARNIADDAWSDRRSDDPRQEAALRRIDELASRATYFRRQVEAYRDQPERTEEDFQRLVSSYVSASAAMNDLHPYGRIPGDFRRLDALMNELTDQYGGQERYWGAYGNDRPTNASLTAGSTVAVRLDTAVRSRDLENGQTIPARLAQDVSVGGRVVGRAGDPALVRVVEMDRAGRVSGKERLTLELAQLRLNGRDYPVYSEDMTFEAEGSTKRDVGTIAGGAAIGALIGAITGGGDEAAKGAAIGAAGGTGVVLLTRGKTVRLPAGQRLDFRLSESVRVRMPRDGERRRERDDARPGNISRRRY